MAYNAQPQWYYRQQSRASAPRRQAQRPARPEHTRQEQPRPEAPRPAPPPRPAPNDRAGRRPGVKEAVERALPAGMDTGDLFLAAMLLFLYIESRDQDFLIILIVVGLSIFKHNREDG